MKIFVVSQCFYPEEFKINDLVETWVKQGHDVTVLTGKPNYPQGEYFKGYCFWGIQKEVYKGANVIRVPLIKRGNGNALRLVLNYFSFVFFGCWYVLFHKIKTDAIFCFALSPITQIYPALTLKRKTKAKTSIWVQDLWPESVSAVGAMKNHGLAWQLLTKMVSSIYKSCDTIFIQSPAFCESICQKGDFQKKIIYAPNWAEDIYIDTACHKEKYQSLMPDGFKVMFAGNIGKAQDFDSIIKAAELTKNNPSIKWVIVGDGRARKDAETTVKDLGLAEKVLFLGRYPAAEMPDFFIHADVLLVSLRRVNIFALTIPSKLQTYMAFGKPIVSMLDGIGNQIINEAHCGLTSLSGDYKSLAANVIKLSEASKEDMAQMGANARGYYQTNFAKLTVTKILTDHII